MASSPHLKNPRSSISADPAARDWASLPPDILISVFLMLGPTEIMLGAERVCAAWRRVAVDDPALWRRIDMGTGVLPFSSGGRAAVHSAVDRAAGECEAFSGPCDNHLLFYLSTLPESPACEASVRGEQSSELGAQQATSP
ncbi:putative F-box/LRR-repeat protein 23 isoform X4 [Panicum virgatum]|uniref:putative F-box/LRR-repeat protein 23 isoform X4 n=1 Tax=Panicum virgatum TaxID=38727 RepID=UPI0019D66262|nr:putative F-box/LRR-repeat protein 23 isoform X4 [Panicum virgatum]